MIIECLAVAAKLGCGISKTSPLLIFTRSGSKGTRLNISETTSRVMPDYIPPPSHRVRGLRRGRRLGRGRLGCRRGLGRSFLGGLLLADELHTADGLIGLGLELF